MYDPTLPYWRQDKAAKVPLPPRGTLLRTNSEETVRMLTVQIWECGKAGSHSGTLDSDGPACSEPLMEG